MAGQLIPRGRAETAGEGPGGASPSACPQSSEALHGLGRRALAPEVHPPLESVPQPR